MIPNPDQIIAATNFTKWVSLAIVAVALFMFLLERYWNGKSSSLVNVALFGAALEALGWSFHRFYWWTWRQARLKYGCFSIDELDVMARAPACELITKMESDYSLITLGPSLAIFVGAALLASPLTRRWFGGFWPVASALIVATIWLIGLGIAQLSTQKAWP